MKLFLTGQRTFGALVLALLLERGEEIVGVSAPRHHADGRADKLYTAAKRLGLPLRQAGGLRASQFPSDVDLLIAAHAHDFISRPVRQKTKLGGIGYHPSLLPRHRGRDAVRWTVKMGDAITGGTVFWLNDHVDGGPIAAQEWCFVRPDDTPQRLWRRELRPLGLQLLEQVLNDLARGIIVARDQDEAVATWEPSWGRPPLYRPELPQLGPPPAGFQVVK